MKLIVICWISVLISGFPAYGAETTTDPSYETLPPVQYGVASWYGDKEQGHRMACGELFNEYAMVAASRTLPFGTAVKVTNLRNGRSVVVWIMDRGPHIAGRAIDLSKAAADQLRFTRQGLTPVRIRVVSTLNKQRWEEVIISDDLRPSASFHCPRGATHAYSSVPWRAETWSFRRNNPEGWQFPDVDNLPHHVERISPVDP